MKGEKIFIYGAGGHAKVVAEAIISCGLIPHAFIDDAAQANQHNLLIGIPIWSPNDPRICFESGRFVVAVGDNHHRYKIFKKMDMNKEVFLKVVHKTTVSSPSACIGAGVMILANTIINAQAVIGDHVILNSGSITEHDCIIGDFSHIAPGAKLGGEVRVGQGVLIGIGATIAPRVSIGDWSIVGAGSVVLRDIPKYSVAVGVPARVIRENVSKGVV